MIKRPNLFLALLAFFGLGVITSCDRDNDDIVPPVVKPDIVFYALSNSNQLLKYNANASQTIMSTVSIAGLPGGEKIIAMDFRPATGQLYGLGNTSRLYVINQETGMATAIGAGPFTPAISGTLAGFDFNPTVDRIRLVTSSGQNLRLNPETGAVAATDAPLNPGTAGIAAVAYTNSVAGAATTVLFDLDLTSGKLFKQDPPNNGTLVEIGPLTTSPVAGNEGGFDISPDNSVALANFTVGGVNSLFQVDLTTGKATNIGAFGGNVIGIAIPTSPVAYALDNANNLLVFNLTIPGTPVSKPITGLQAGENLLGIDMRPATGQLYGLGSTSRIYTINMSSGAATQVGAGPFVPALIGTSFGFDFNPTVDRIRVVSNTGQNLRLNPVDGTTAATDAALNPGIPMVSAVAYTNNFAGATITVLFDIDPSTDKLYTQIPPNNGTLVEVGNLGINVETNNGFDIGGISNKGYALFTVGATTKIYTINLTTGAAVELATLPGSARGFAVGLGF